MGIPNFGNTYLWSITQPTTTPIRIKVSMPIPPAATATNYLAQENPVLELQGEEAVLRGVASALMFAKQDMSLWTLPWHFGHNISFASSPDRTRRSKVFLQLSHTNSYMGISFSFLLTNTWFYINLFLTFEKGRGSL